MTGARAKYEAFCRAGSANRIRQLRLSLGYKTAASFARVIGWSPAKYRYYELHGFVFSGPIVQLAMAVENAGFGSISLEWLCGFGPIWRTRPAKRAVRTEGNVVHANFAR